MIQWKRFLSSLASIFFVLLFRGISSTTICNARDLGTSKWIVPKKSRHELDLYIHRGLNYTIVNAFTDIFLELNLTDEDSYDLYKAENCNVVLQDFHSDNRLFGLLKGANFWRSHELSLFNDTVIGIATQLPYTVQAKILKINYIRFGVFVSGILLFIFAKDLVRNPLFFYGSGCSLGLLASLLIVVFIIYRLAPKSLIRLPILIGGWSLSFYVLHFVWRNLTTIAFQYQKFLLAYFVIVLAISFAVCYKRGPPTDNRSYDIAQWTLQAIALVFIYSAVKVQEVSVGIIVILLLHSLMRSWHWNPLQKTTNIWWKIFPPKQRLLTEEEYEREGQEVTRRELERLREFCRSPKADVWKLTSKVRDPKRLARFVDGKEDHILADEEDLYDDDSDCLNQNNHVDDDDDYDENQEHLFIDDDDNEWEEQVELQRTPKSRRENALSKKSSRRSTGFLPSNSSHFVELPVHSRSAYYYQDNSPLDKPRHLVNSTFAASKSKRLPPLKTGNDSSFIRKYKEHQELSKIQRKRRVRPTSNEFFSSDSESD